MKGWTEVKSGQLAMYKSTKYNKHKPSKIGISFFLHFIKVCGTTPHPSLVTVHMCVPSNHTDSSSIYSLPEITHMPPYNELFITIGANERTQNWPISFYVYTLVRPVLQPSFHPKYACITS